MLIYNQKETKETNTVVEVYKKLEEAIAMGEYMKSKQQKKKSENMQCTVVLMQICSFYSKIN